MTDVCVEGEAGAAPAIEVDGLSKAFGARRAVDDLSFAVPAGSCLAVLGPNGAGKTTLVRMLATLARPSCGHARILGRDVVQDADEVRGMVGLVSHQPLVYGELTAEENLLLHARLNGVRDPARRTAMLLDAVGLSTRRLDQVRTFSRGMMQRLAVARSLVADPPVVLLDEPYAGLDPQAAGALDGLIERDRGRRTFAMVCHDVPRAFRLCTHVLVMARGAGVLFAERSSIDYESLVCGYASVFGEGAS